MSSIPFERYDEEFDSLTQQVQASLQSCKSHPTESDLQFASSLLMQCDDLLKQMSVEARGVDDVGAKRTLLEKVRACKSQLAQLRHDHASVQSQMERESLLGASSSHSRRGSSSSEHKQRLLDTEQQIGAQNDTLENARRVMAETEEVALEITTELGRNRETIQSAHGRVRDVSGLTNRARRIVQNMSRREVQQKIAMYIMAVMIVVVVFIILYNLR